MSEPHKIVTMTEDESRRYWDRREAIGALRAAVRDGLIDPDVAEGQIAALLDESYARYLRDFDAGLDTVRD